MVGRAQGVRKAGLVERRAPPDPVPLGKAFDPYMEAFLKTVIALELVQK